MMDLEDVKGRIKEILSASIDGSLPENLEDHLNRFQADYEEYYSNEGDTGNVWKGKYEELKEKYISRFMDGPAQIEEKMGEKTIENSEVEVIEEETSKIEDVTIDELFEEVKANGT